MDLAGPFAQDGGKYWARRLVASKRLAVDIVAHACRHLHT